MSKQRLLIMSLGLVLSAPLPAMAAEVTYGPVARQETLWSIAKRLRPNESVTVQQTMLALYHKNPQAFHKRNINTLLKGSVLDIPTVTEISRYGQQQAVRETRTQNRNWRNGTNLSSTSSGGQRALEQQVSRLRKQLRDANARNERLEGRLAQVTRQRGSAEAEANAAVQAQLERLKSELSDLKTVLGQKDNHIKTLRTSLKSASETIKSQHADNLRIYNKLQEVSPETAAQEQAAAPPSEQASSLKLSSVEEDNQARAAEQDAAQANAANVNEAAKEATAAEDKAPEAQGENAKSQDKKADQADSVWADENAETTAATEQTEQAVTDNPDNAAASADSADADDSADNDASAPLFDPRPANNSQMQATNDVRQTSDDSAVIIGDNARSKTSNSFLSDKLNIGGVQISLLTAAVVLACLLFIGLLLWRAYAQQREIDRLKEEERLRGEKMRERLVANSKTDLERLKMDNPPPVEDEG